MRLNKSELDEILKKNKHVTVDDPKVRNFNPSQCQVHIEKNTTGKDVNVFINPESKKMSLSFDSPKILSFTVPGIPVPAPRQTQRDKWMKRPCVMRYREYADRLRSFINLHDMYVGKITMKFFLPMPDSWSFKKKEKFDGKPHRSKPDHDNLTKAVQDCLLKNDAMVWSCFTQKFWCFKGIERTELTFETTE